MSTDVELSSLNLFVNSWRYIFAVVWSWIIKVFSSELFSALLLQLCEPVNKIGSEAIISASAIAYLWCIVFGIPECDLTLTPASSILSNSAYCEFVDSIIPRTLVPKLLCTSIIASPRSSLVNSSNANSNV